MNKIWIKANQFARLKSAEIDSLDEAQLKAYEDDLSEHLQAQEKELKDKIKSLEDSSEDSSEEIKELKSKLDAIDLESFKSAVNKQGIMLQELKKGNLGGMSVQTVKAQINEFISKNADEIKALKNQGHGFIEMTIKAPESITTGSATNPDGIPELVGTQLAPATNVNLRASIVDGLVTSLNTDLAAYPYTESVPKDGDYAFVAEAGTKPQIDFKTETRYAEPVKVAAHEILTDESVKDIRGLQGIAENFLKSKHDLKRQAGILFGDGIAPNPKGATVYGRTFVAGDMALSVATPNFMDVVNACITDIYTTHNYQDETPYMANLVMVNPIDFFIELVSAKDGNGLPLYPTASLFNRVTIGGVTIIPFENIPAGKIFVADMSKYNVTDYVSYTVKIGWINDQLITNQFTMVGESRFHAFVKKLDEQAFVYDDIATIKTAIEKV